MTESHKAKTVDDVLATLRNVTGDIASVIAAAVSDYNDEKRLHAETTANMERFRARGLELERENAELKTRLGTNRSDALALMERSLKARQLLAALSEDNPAYDATVRAVALLDAEMERMVANPQPRPSEGTADANEDYYYREWIRRRFEVEALANCLAAMTAWTETLCEKVGWTPENAGAIWDCVRTSRAEIEKANAPQSRLPAGSEVPVASNGLQEMVDRFLAWPLPRGVCADLCVTEPNYPHPRSGTNLLDANAAREMLRHVVGEPEGDVTVSCNDAGECIAVTRTDDDGRILSVIWEREPRPLSGTSEAERLRDLMRRSLRARQAMNATDDDAIYHEAVHTVAQLDAEMEREVLVAGDGKP